MTEQWHFRQAQPLPRNGKTLIMGIVNLTPDSFSGRGLPAPSPREAVANALAMLEAGADIIDFGAESSRPGATCLSHNEEISRLGDAVAWLREKSTAPISVDTYHPETAAHVLRQGADIINDITALRGGWGKNSADNPAMAELVARYHAHVVLMHMPSAPAVMQDAPEYSDVVTEVKDFLQQQAKWAENHGIQHDAIWLDPGFGFGKTFIHNREMLRRLGEFAACGYPVLAGMSRKRMIADALGLGTGDRLEASLALAVLAASNGAAIVRVHDVRETARAVGMANAILGKLFWSE